MTWLRQITGSFKRAATPNDNQPRIFLDSITFSDGTTLSLRLNEVLVITGPNNTGKSSVLRELRNYLLDDDAKLGPVVKSADFKVIGAVDAFRKLIEEQSVDAKHMILGPGTVSLGGATYRIANIEADYKNAFVGSKASTVLFSHLAAGERLELTEPTRKDDYSNNAPKNPLQWLELEESFEERVSDEFERTFRQKLVLNRMGGQNLTLHLYRPTEAQEVPVGNTRTRAKWLGQLPPLHRQGDGVRSYVGTLLELSVHPKGLILLDEPEAFLHPPQVRRLASLVTESSAQLIVATHSDEFIRGLLDSVADRVTVVRIDRALDQNKITVLNSVDIQNLWSDPILRTSDALSSLFHEVAIICEGDSDARFFRALLEATESDVRDRDYRLFHFGGKDRISNIARALRAIGVPVVSIVDIDILENREKFLSLFERMGGHRKQVEVDLLLIQKSVAERKGQISAIELAIELDRLSKKLREENAVTSEFRKEVSQLVRTGSNWQRIKEDGYIGLVAAPAIEAFERIMNTSKSIGLLINPQGELEGFCRQISRSRKSEWLASVLSRNLASDPALDQARTFAKTLRETLDNAVSANMST